MDTTASEARAGRAGDSGRAPLVALVVPIVLLQLAVVLPLVLGTHTLWLRDVLTTHLPMREAEAAALRAGTLPVLDVQRGGGQPLLGNPNGAPLYPTGLLDVLGAPYWSLGAHFWLHFLIAPWSFYWLARRLGRERGAAWAGGAIYALSGFFLSQMSFYNLIGGVTLAPAFVAACLAACDSAGSPAERAPLRRRAVVGALWALLLLAGEPALAVLALLAAALAVAFVLERGARADALRLLLPLALGTLVAAPQLVELLRALPTSTRGARGFTLAQQLQNSWDPRQVLEQLLPLAFGRLTRSTGSAFWAHRLFDGALPLFPTLYPGLLTLALVGVGVRRARGDEPDGDARSRRFAIALLIVGLLLALGRFDPLLRLVLWLPGASLLRFPVKAWLLVMIGIAALAARGWEHVSARDGARRRLRATLVALSVMLATAAAIFALARLPLAEWMTRQLGPGAPLQAVTGEPARWIILALLGAALAAGLALLASFVGRSALLPALLLIVHGVTQLALLAPATLAQERIDALRPLPGLVAHLRAGTRIAHGGVRGLFGGFAPRPPADGSTRWLARQGAAAGLPFVGVPRGWRYELAASPEDLDAFVTRMAADAVRRAPDELRLRLLRLWGVQALIVERPLGPTPAAKLLVAAEGPLAPVMLYAVRDPVPELRWASRVRGAATPAAALAALVDPSFDARCEVVLATAAASPRSAGGACAPVPLRLAREETERIVIDVSAAAPGWIVAQRTWQPQWRAMVDDHPAPILVADLQRMAVAIPAGEHRLELAVDRRPVHRALVLAIVALVGLIALAVAPSDRSAAGP